MLQVRKVKPEDISFVMQLTEKSGISEGKLLSNIGSFLICEEDNVKCGCGCLVSSGNEGFLNWVAVSAEHRGNGLGSAITKALLNIADRKGIEEVYAEGICVGFLKAMGFQETSCNKAAEDGARAVLGVTGAYGFYKVALKDYFKCCSKK